MIAIAAVDRNNGLGKDGHLLVYLSSDLQQFKARTMGKVLIYGRKTLATFPKEQPLPKRLNLVLSRQDLTVPGAEVLPSLEALHARLAELRREGYSDDDFVVIGGASIYHSLLPEITDFYLTEIDADLGADCFLDDLAAAGFVQMTCAAEQEEKGLRYRICHYRRQH